MSSAVKQEKIRVYETILSSPGMTEKCKISLHVSRQQIILLGRLIEIGLGNQKGEPEDTILNSLPEGTMEEFRDMYAEILKKADLTDFYEKLKSI